MNHKSSNEEVHKHWGRLGQSLLNSMIGEYLEKEKNPLAIQMGFQHQSKKLSLDSQLAHQLDFALSNKVVVFVHGLTNLETVWDYPPEGSSNESIVGHYIDACFDPVKHSPQESYGKQLQEEFGYTPLYLCYNTGLSLEQNGRKFAMQLTQLFKVYPIQIDDLMLVGYNMGGRLLSHAQFSAQQNNYAWLKVLSKCIYLGNSNEGSLLANIVQLGSDVIRSIPIHYLNLLADWLEYRSKQLQEIKRKTSRYNSNREQGAESTLFLESSRHYFISGDFKKNKQNALSETTGDSPFWQNGVAVPSHSQNAHIEGISPIRLAHSNKVYPLISKWVGEEKSKYCDEAGEAQKLTFYNPPQGVCAEGAIHYDSTNNAFIAGTVDLMASAYDKTVETVETIHYSIAEEPFYVLDKLPIGSQIAKPVEAAQRDILDIIYRSLRSGGRMMHKVAADIAPDEMASKTHP